jgi:hypothetical protein
VRVLLVAEGEGVFADALSEVRDGGWRVVDGFRERAGDNVVCAGVVADENDAAAALSRGAGSSSTPARHAT